MITRFYKILYKKETVVYIGVTLRSITTRFKEHIKSKGLDPPLYSVVEFDHIVHPEINSLDVYHEEREKVATLEQKYIKDEINRGAHLLNISPGGEWGSHIRESLEKELFFQKYNSYEGYTKHRKLTRKTKNWLRSWKTTRTTSRTKQWFWWWMQRKYPKLRLWTHNWVVNKGINKTHRWCLSWVHGKSTNRVKCWLHRWRTGLSRGKVQRWCRSWVKSRSEGKVKRWLHNWTVNKKMRKTQRWLFNWRTNRGMSKTKKWLNRWRSNKVYPRGKLYKT